MERCENCGRVIGELETAHVWREKVVCNACRSALAVEDVPVAQRAGLPRWLVAGAGTLLLLVAIGVILYASEVSRNRRAAAEEEARRIAQEEVDAINAEFRREWARFFDKRDDERELQNQRFRIKLIGATGYTRDITLVKQSAYNESRDIDDKSFIRLAKEGFTVAEAEEIVKQRNKAGEEGQAKSPSSWFR